MSIYNKELYKRLLNSTRIEEIEEIATEESSQSILRTEINIVFDSETSLNALSCTLRAVGKCIGLSINTVNDLKNNREFELISLVLIVTEDIEKCKQIYGTDFYKSTSDKVYLVKDITECILTRALQMKEKYPNSIILVQTLPSPLISPMGIQDLYMNESLGWTILRINLELIEVFRELANNNIYLLGHHQYANSVTREYWDMTVWNKMDNAEQTKNIHNLTTPAWSICHWVYPLVFPCIKEVAVDLDNTLWEGIFAEDGIENLKMGLERPGYHHYKLQTTLQSLSQKGVLLSFISRNESQRIENAVKVLIDSGKLIVSPVTIEADLYQKKAVLIENSCKNLNNISPTSVVFLDNSDIEREIVDKSGIGCTIAPFPSNISLLETMFMHMPYLEKIRINKADYERSIWYKETQKGELEFDIELVTNIFDEIVIQRIEELINKTNQFNMTSKRYKYCDLKVLLFQAEYSFFVFRAIPIGETAIKPDIFCVAIVKSQNKTWIIENFLMSCRYMALGLDRKALSIIVTEALENNVIYLVGIYEQTNRNLLVKDWYKRNGFLFIKQENGRDYYRTLVTDIERSLRNNPECMDIETYLNNKIKLQPLNTNVISRVRKKDNSIEILIPSGHLKPGIDDVDAKYLEALFGLYPSAELNIPEKYIDSFWIDKYCITNSQYTNFVNEYFSAYEDKNIFLEEINSKQPLCQLRIDNESKIVKYCTGTEKWPVLLPIEYAKLYVKWVNGRLPTEVEWEWAARGLDQRWFPWGNYLPTYKLVWTNPMHVGDVDAIQENISPFGVVGMVGNVWQWCSSKYRNHPQYRGGDYRLDAMYWKRTTLRPLEAAEHCGNAVGFRVVRTL